MFLFCPTSSTFLSASKGHNANRGVFFLIMSAIRLCYSIDMSHVTERGRRCQRSNCTVKTQYLTAFKPIQLGRRTKQERFSAHFLSACECMCILTNFLFSLFLSLSPSLGFARHVITTTRRPQGFGSTGRGFGSPTDFGALNDFSQQGGKMSLDRSNNRYNPIGSGGGYTAGTGIGIAYGGTPGGGIREAAPTQFSRMTTDTYGGQGGANFGNMARPGGGAYAGRY